MPDYVHKTTLKLFKSLSPSSLPEAIDNYLQLTRAEYLAALSIPLRYRKLVADVVTEMSQAEKDAVDAQETSDVRDRKIVESIDDVESVLRHTIYLTMREVNILRGWIVDFKNATAAATSLADFKSKIAALDDLPDRTFEQFKNQIRSDLGS